LGCQRFKILDSKVSDQELRTATIKILDETPMVSVPNELFRLTAMLKKVLKKQQLNTSLDGAQFDDANWVGCRLTEVLPMENVIRQRLLEIDDPIERLHIILGLFSER